MQKSCDKPLLILASKSLRRKYLLEQAGLSFFVIPSSIDENSIPILSPETYVRALAEAKAHDISKRYPENWIIGADTIILIQDTILGKPDSRKEARPKSVRLLVEVNSSTFLIRKLNGIIHTKEPFGKAGAYAIQGLGTFLVKSINGSYTNVVGLPVCEVVEFFIKEGIICLRNL